MNGPSSGVGVVAEIELDVERLLAKVGRNTCKFKRLDGRPGKEGLVGGAEASEMLRKRLTIVGMSLVFDGGESACGMLTKRFMR